MQVPLFRVAVVEDHPLSSHAFVSAVNSMPDMEVVGAADDVDEGLALLRHTRPHLLVVDLGLPSGSGLALIREALHLYGTTCSSAVLTMTGNEAHLLKAIRAGASGYLFKSDDELAWLTGLRTLSQGGGLLFHGLARHLMGLPEIRSNAHLRPFVELLAAGHAHNEVANRLGISELNLAQNISRCYANLRDAVPMLSKREVELLELLNQGSSFKQSALCMGIQESTAKTLATRAYQKLGATNLQEALYAARREHIFR